MKQVKMTFVVTVPLDLMIDEQSLHDDFDGDIEKVARYLFENEGCWWEEGMDLIKSEIVESK